MDFSLNDEQKLIQESIDKFIQNDYSFESRQKILAEDTGYSEDNWNTFAELGWLALLFSEDDGGFGGSAVDLTVIMEAFGKGLVLEPFWSTIILAGNLLSQLGSDEQKQTIIPAIIEGKLKLAFAHSEPQSRFNLSDVTTHAKTDGEQFILNGHKSVVMHASTADKIIVSARTSGTQQSEQGISLFLVDANTPGITIQSYPTVDGLSAAEVILENVEVKQNQLLGQQDQAFSAIEQTTDHAILALGAEAVGAMETLYKATVEYCKTRVQFGQPIGKFQVLQHRMVDMFMEYEQSKSLMFMAAITMENPDETATAKAKAASAFKAQIGKAGRFIGQEAVQLHGGMGMTEELNVGHYFKRLTVIDTLLGNTDYHLARFTELTKSK